MWNNILTKAVSSRLFLKNQEEVWQFTENSWQLLPNQNKPE